MRMKIYLLALAACSTAGAYTFPQQKAFNTYTAWTNAEADRITLQRVIVSMAGQPSNTTTIKIVNGVTTQTLVSSGSSSFTTAIWPIGTNAPDKYLYPGDYIIASNSRTNFSSLYISGYQPTNAGGSGSGFPLTNNADFAGFGALNVGFIGETNASPGMTLTKAPTGYVHEFTIRGVTNYLDFVTALSGDVRDFYPGQLMRYTDGNVYQLTTTLWSTNYINAPGTNAIPNPESNPSMWSLFVAKGTDGERGPAGGTGNDGTDGLDGSGNIQFGPWDVLKQYNYNVSTQIVVSRLGRWYELTNTMGSLGDDPAGVSGPTYWQISVDKGVSGTLIGSTNLIHRGAWDSGTPYTTNDVVTYYGNQFYIYTNEAHTGHAPTVGGTGVGSDSRYWDVLVAKGTKGDTGAQGPAGEDGIYLSEVYNVHFVFDTNYTQFLNNPTTSNDVPVFMYSTNSGGIPTNVFKWLPGVLGATITESTNASSVTTNSGRVLVVNIRTNAGGTGGSGSVNWTQAWATATTDGSTQTVMVANGAAGTLLAGNGTAAAPSYKTLAALGIPTGTPLYVESGTGTLVAASLNGYATNDQWDADVAAATANMATGNQWNATLGSYAQLSSPIFTNNLTVSNGNVVLAGTPNSHGIVFPDGTIQYTSPTGSISAAVTSAVSIIYTMGADPRVGLTALDFYGQGGLSATSQLVGTTGKVYFTQAQADSNYPLRVYNVLNATSQLATIGLGNGKAYRLANMSSVTTIAVDSAVSAGGIYNAMFAMPTGSQTMVAFPATMWDQALINAISWSATTDTIVNVTAVEGGKANVYQLFYAP